MIEPHDTGRVNRTPGRFEAVHAAKGRGPDQRTGGLAAEGQRHHAVGNGRGPRCPRRPAAQSTKEQGLSQAPSVCRRAEWRSRRRRADEQKSPRFIAVASLVGQIDSPISSARAHTAYDASGVYEAIENHSAHRSPRVLIPPRKGAQLASGPASSRQRNRNIAAQARLGKRKVAHRIGLQQTEQSRDNVPSLQGYRGLSDASERVGGTEMGNP